MFGVRIPCSTTPVFRKYWELLERIAHVTTPTSHPPVNMVPILKLVPERFASWKTECREIRVLQRNIFGRMLRPVEERLAQGNGNGCYMETVKERADDWDLDSEAIL